MSSIPALKKILDLRSEEKNQALLEQKEAIDQFEKVAKQLYRQLKAKEKAESNLYEMHEGSLVISQIREQTNYIEALNKKINLLEKEVQKARFNMEAKQDKVTEKHVEFKKIEKMIENREEKLKEQVKKEALAELDEISLNRYIRAE